MFYTIKLSQLTCVLNLFVFQKTKNKKVKNKKRLISLFLHKVLMQGAADTIFFFLFSEKYLLLKLVFVIMSLQDNIIFKFTDLHRNNIM